jgi:elongation factor P--(R)-beta-lysine ligase
MKPPEDRKSQSLKVTNWRPTASVGVLRQRAELIERTRHFFRERSVLEVDTPVLQGGANLDHGVLPYHLDLGHGARFLPTSPEHPLKRLVAADYGDVWTLAPAFRVGECGRRHSPEFRMLEWYRLGWDDRRLAEEVITLLALLTDKTSAHSIISWRNAFRTHANVDPFTADDATIMTRLGNDAAVANGDRRIALDLLLTRDIEPHLGRDSWTVLTDYPADQCAQARIRSDLNGTPVAARFEIYRDGIELANGYHELRDGSQLRERLTSELATRTTGEQLDERFLSAMTHGLPDCAGVAVGFDRVVMLALGLNHIEQTQAFGWENT